MQKTKLVNLQHFIEDNGYLTVVQEKSGVMPFAMIRIFNVCANKGDKRGEHAHKKCSQFVVPIYGRIDLEIEDKINKKKITLNHKKKQGYLLKPKTWCKIKFKSNHSILMIFCDREYEFKDYIESYKEFINIIKKK